MFNNSQTVATHIFTMIITMFSKTGISGSSIHLLPHSLISIYSSPTEHKAFFYALGTQKIPTLREFILLRGIIQTK